MNTFYIARHGETEGNRDKRLSGWLDTPLTDTGLDPTTEVLTKLAGIQIDEIYSSDIGRAFITAYVISRGLNFTEEIQRLAGLREMNYGDAAHMYIDDAYKQYEGLGKNTQFAPPNGESFEQMRERALATVGRLNDNHEDANILLVCHSGVMAAIKSNFTGTQNTYLHYF